MSDGICTVAGCINPELAKGWCNPHYIRVRKYGNPLPNKPLLVRASRRSKSTDCAVPGCTKPELTRGWCSAHYSRWVRHGDPLAGRIPEDEPRTFFFATVDLIQDDCLIWPYTLSAAGYGRLQINGQRYLTHALSCERRHGSRPPGMQSAHGPCHDRSCYNGNHLSWKTPMENNHDRFRDGTVLWGEQITQSKLTEDDIRAIRKRRTAGESRVVIAREFGVHPEHIGDITSFRYWKNVT